MERLSAQLDGLNLTLVELADEQLTIAVEYKSDWVKLSLDVWFWLTDFTSFLEQLRCLYTSLQGKATLSPRYGNDCVITLSINHLGHIAGEICLERHANLIDEFSGNFRVDQSYLPQFIDDCELMWGHLVKHKFEDNIKENI